MEIVKKKIRMSRQRSQAMNQITLEEDLNVPDSKADVTGIIQHRAKVRVEEQDHGKSDSGKRKSGSVDALPGGRRTASRLPSSGKTAVFGKAEPGRGKAGR